MRATIAVLAAAVCVGGVAAPSALRAQAADTRCGIAGKAIVPANTPAIRVPGNCASLADFLRDAFSEKMRVKKADAVSPRAMQSRHSDGASASGTPGQVEAAPSVQPTALAAASIAAAGTDSGTKSIAAFSFNPATLFGGTDSAAAAHWSRFGDLTLLVPMSSTGATSETFSYVGIRARYNYSAGSQADALLVKTNEAFDKLLAGNQQLENEILTTLMGLESADKVEACSRAIVAAKLGESPPACGGKLKLALSADDYAAFQKAATAAREVADRTTIGFDFRLDKGDPTLSGAHSKNATAFSVGGAGAWNVGGADASRPISSFRFWLAARYSDDKVNAQPVRLWSGEGALALQTGRLVSDDQFFSANVGLHIRASGGTSVQRDSVAPNIMAVEGGLRLPLAGGSSVSVGFSVPIHSKVSPSLTVNLDWGLLLSALSAAAPARPE